MNLKDENEKEEIVEVTDETEGKTEVVESPKSEREEIEDTEKKEPEETITVESENETEKKEVDTIAEETKPEVIEEKELINDEAKKEEAPKDDKPKDEETSKTYKQVKNVKEKKKVRWGIIIPIIAVLFLIAILVSTIFALVNMGNENVLGGIKVKGVDLTGLSMEDAKLEITEAVKNELSKNAILKYGDYETSISPEQIEAKYDIDKVMDEVYNYGRSSNIIVNNYEIMFALINEKEFEPEFSYNEKALEDMLNDITKKIPGAMKDNSFYIEGETLIITEGKPGMAVKVDEMKKEVIEQIKNPTNTALNIKVYNSVPEKINIDKIYEQVKKDPQNAYVSHDPFEIHPSENGIDFAVSLEEARRIVSEQKEEYEIPLKFIAPEISTADLGEEAFPNLLARFTTNYNEWLENRSTNLWLASEKINGTVLLPGEEFSYNRVVGERTIAAGYKEAAIYSGGEVVDGLGGGICQISSTLYDLAVKANMKITDRSNHQFVTSYIEAGKDATVVYGYIDFKFVNTRKYPVKILSTVSDGVVEMKMMGVREETEYEIELETEYIDTLSWGVSYIDDPNMDAGEEYVKQYGSSGYNTVTYKVYKLNGEEVNREVLSYDTYDAMTKIIVRGTRNVQPVVVTSPEITKNEITTPTKPSTNTTTTVTTTTNTTNTAN